MKKNFLSLFLAISLLYPKFINVQNGIPNVILNGTISSYSNNKHFYYSNDLYAKIDTNQKVFVKGDNQYSFDLSKTPFKNSKVDKLYFGWELNKEGQIANGCYSEINIAVIRDYCSKNKLKAITLKNDFNLTFNCESTIAEEFSAEQEKLAGNYKMVLNDTIYNFKLSTDMLSIISGDYTPTDKNFCNKLWGWWGYNNTEKELNFSVQYFRNKDWGIYINANCIFSFTVTKNESGKFIFKNSNDKIILEKR